MASTIHLRPTAPLADRVLLPGDPGRALLLAQRLLESPKMFNHNRGLWGYSGLAEDGELLTIQSTGMGGPSAAIVAAELAELGARRLLRVGTCGALSDALALGDLLIATEAMAYDGTSRALGAGEPISASQPLLAALVEACGGLAHEGAVATTDLFYDTPADQEQRWLAAGALAVEMESATLFALSARRGFQAASLLIVSDVVMPQRARIDAEALREAEWRLGDLAYVAVSLRRGDSALRRGGAVA